MDNNTVMIMWHRHSKQIFALGTSVTYWNC